MCWCWYGDVVLLIVMMLMLYVFVEFIVLLESDVIDVSGDGLVIE